MTRRVRARIDGSSAARAPRVTRRGGRFRRAWLPVLGDGNRYRDAARTVVQWGEDPRGASRCLVAEAGIGKPEVSHGCEMARPLAVESCFAGKEALSCRSPPDLD